ncbi:salicylate synthase [Nocardia thraciensis]
MADPVATVAALAASDRFGDHVVYERPGSWVFAADPVGRIELDHGELRLEYQGRNRVLPWADRPIAGLRSGLDELRAQGCDGVVYGWLGFELCAHRFGADRYVPEGTPLARLMVPRLEVQVATSGVVVRGATPSDLDVLEHLLTGPPAPSDVPGFVDIHADPSGYRERVAAAGAEIRSGRYQKVILSRRVDVPYPVDLPATYRLARAHNTPARSFLFRLDGMAAAGFSPELIVATTEDGRISTEPLAGTRAFGRGADADRRARDHLQSDPKEIVEHAISVKAALAELATVAAPDSSSVSDFMSVRERGSVQHLASTVQGILAPGRDGWDAVEALFPAITASGIPKHPAIDAIFRHENHPRGPYSGAVVALSPSGAIDAALILRAVYQSGNRSWLHAGAGIVEQSRPDREFEETCEKLASVANHIVPLHRRG